MRVLVPDTDESRWAVHGISHWNDRREETTVRVENDGSEGQTFLQTMPRLGTVLGPFGSVHGMVTDPVTVAEHAVLNIFLGAIPPGLTDDEAQAAVRDAQTQARAVAADREAWDVVPLLLDGIEYAFWTRNVPGGVAAHADLGWATIAAWSSTVLHVGPFALREVA